MSDAPLDLLIRQGLIFDGRGSVPWQGDIGIRSGKIVLMAPQIETPTHEVIEAAGLWVTPGFLDIHTHYDIEVEISPGLPESVRHGVTTVVMGNCSLSITMGDPQDLADIFLRVESLPDPLIRRWLSGSVDWQTPAEYLQHLQALPLGANVAPLLGHSALRVAVMGLERSLGDPATEADLQQMEQLAEAALAAGCIGISIDMVHWHKVTGRFAGRSIPSHHASWQEYTRLAAVCRRRDAVFQVTPNPPDPRSIWFLLWLALGIFRDPLRITILSALDLPSNRILWRAFPLATFVFNRILGCNIRFQTLTEPFTTYADGCLTPLFEEFPTGVQLNSAGSTQARQNLWQDPHFRKRFRQEWQASGFKSFHRDLSLISIESCPDPNLLNQTIQQVAAVKNQDPLDFFMECLERFDDQFRWVSTGANDRDRIREKLMSHPFILPGFTDAGAHSRHLGFFDGALSLLRQAATTQFMPMEAAIARVTGEPARWFGLEAGILKIGSRADLNLIRPEGLQTPIPEPIERADPLLEGAYRLVKRGSEGIIEKVLIAGIPVVEAGEPLATLGQTRAGTVLCSTGDSLAERRIRFRNRLHDQEWDHPFVDYWDVFVYKHQNWGNIAFHCGAVVMTYVAVIGLIVTGQIVWIGVWFASRLVGLVGHFLYERSPIDFQDFVFSWRASVCLNRLLFQVLTGQYSHSIRQVQATYQRFHQQAFTPTEESSSLDLDMMAYSNGAPQS